MLDVLQKLAWFFKLEWKRYTVVVILMLLGGILEIIPPMLVAMSIDAIHTNSMTWTSLTITLLQIGSIAIIAYIMVYIWLYKLFGGSFVVERLMRTRLVRHFLKMTPSFYERNRTGDLMARATNDLQAISTTAGFGILTLIDSTLWMATLLTVMSVFVSWKLTLAAILPLPIMAVLVSIYGRWIHSRFTAAQNAFGEMNDGVLETISGIRVTRAYVQEREAEQQFDDVTQDVLNKNLAVVRIDALFEPTIRILVGISYLIGLGYGAYLVFQTELTIGGLVAFNVYLGMLIWPMFAIGEMINIMQRGNASLDRVGATLGYNPDVLEPSETIDVPEPQDIVFDDVTFRYPSSKGLNLEHVSFQIKQGRTLGIVGSTGSGKTTLVKQLLREYPPGSGSITISGVPIERINMDQLKSWYGYVLQEQFLFSRSVRENILFASKDSADEEALQRAIQDSALAKDIDFLPQGLETMVGEKGVALSGGQKQRVSIARALIAEPQILILDDAMSAVDARTEAEIIGNIRRTRQGKTTIITTHRLSAVQHAEDIVVMAEGRVIEQGTHEQLMDQKGWYQTQYLHQQVESGADGPEGEGR